MTRKLHLEEEAIAEAIEAARWYEWQRPGLGQLVGAAIDAAIAHVLAYPHGGTRIPGLEDERQARRHLVQDFPCHRAYPSSARLLAGSLSSPVPLSFQIQLA